jgi:hypothetical protein
VALKATSVACRIAPDLLAASPGTRAVYLHLPAEAYITAILAAASGQADLRIFEALRHRRLSAKFAREVPAGGSAGELAAIAWMVECDSLKRAMAAGGSRVMSLDFETLLADLEGNLARVLRHFDLPPVADRLVKSPALTRYSKAPEQLAFSPEIRAQLMRRSRDMHAEEIEKGLALIESLQQG